MDAERHLSIPQVPSTPGFEISAPAYWLELPCSSESRQDMEGG